MDGYAGRDNVQNDVVLGVTHAKANPKCQILPDFLSPDLCRHLPSRVKCGHSDTRPVDMKQEYIANTKIKLTLSVD